MKLTRINSETQCQLDIKRLRLPVEITGECPCCKAPFKYDLSKDDYISYPTVNVPRKDLVRGYCHECDHEWDIWLRLTVCLEVEQRWPRNANQTESRET